MARNSSATERPATSAKQTSTAKASTQKPSTTTNKTQHLIDASLKRRARLLITNNSIPKQTRNLILYALQIKDPHLAQVVRRVESGEMTIECLQAE